MENKARDSGCQHHQVQTLRDVAAACEACAHSDAWPLCRGWQAVLDNHLPPLIQEYSARWGRVPLPAEIALDERAAQQLAREVVVGRKRKIKDFERVLRHCAARAAEQQIVRELLAKQNSPYWDIVFATAMALACRWKGVSPGSPTPQQFADNTWLNAVLGGRLDGNDDRYDEIVDTATAVYGKIRRNLRSFRGESRLDTWCATIVRHTFIDRWRQRTDTLVNDDDPQQTQVVCTIYLSQGDGRSGRAEGDAGEAIEPRATYDETEDNVQADDAMEAYRASIATYLEQTKADAEEAVTYGQIFDQAWLADRPHQEIADAHEGFDRNRVDDLLSDYRLSSEGQRFKQELHDRKLDDE